MITLLPFHRVVAAIAIIYAIVVVTFIVIFNITGIASIEWAVKGSTTLSLVLFAFVTFGWRKVWEIFPALNRWVYPDLNGKWHAKIHWCHEDKTGIKEATAFIRQNLIRISIELVSDESESETLMVKPQQDPESRRPMLFYIYRNESKQSAATPQPPHKGAAILKVNPTNPNLLEGNYFTDRATKGHYVLERVGET